MIKANELRIGNRVSWNPRLANPTTTLVPMHIEVFAVLPDSVNYVFPNIENRVEPFEDDVAQTGERYVPLIELEPLPLTADVLEKYGFEKTEDAASGLRYQNAWLAVKFAQEPIVVLGHKTINCPHLHRFQNLYFALTGEELEMDT